MAEARHGFSADSEVSQIQAYVTLCARAIAPDMPVLQGLPEARNGLVTGCGAASVWLEMACKLLISYARRSHEQLRT